MSLYPELSNKALLNELNRLRRRLTSLRIESDAALLKGEDDSFLGLRREIQHVEKDISRTAFVLRGRGHSF